MALLTGDERQAIALIVAGLEPSQRDRMQSDLATAEIEVVNADRSILRFHLTNHCRSRPGQKAMHPEAKVRDQDGELLDAVLFQDADGRLLEFELVRYAEGPVIGPNWSTLQIRS